MGGREIGCERDRERGGGGEIEGSRKGGRKKRQRQT